MPDDEGLFQFLNGVCFVRAERQVAGLIREQREAIVGKDSPDPPEFRKNEERRFVRGKREMRDPFFILENPFPDPGFRKLIFFVFGKETLIRAADRTVSGGPPEFQGEEVFRGRA